MKKTSANFHLTIGFCFSIFRRKAIFFFFLFFCLSFSVVHEFMCPYYIMCKKFSIKFLITYRNQGKIAEKYLVRHISISNKQWINLKHACNFCYRIRKTRFRKLIIN